MLYEEAGVSFKRVEDFLRRLEEEIDILSFSQEVDLIELSQGYRNPVFIFSVDGIGTKIRLAVELNKLDGLGQDLIGMVFNDIATKGGKPVFLMDYIAVGYLEPEVLEIFMKGLFKSLRELDERVRLIGGETAQLSDIFSRPKDFDVAGFGCGIAEREKIPKREWVREGDVILGLPSSGFHSNGFTLIRKIIEKNRSILDQLVDGKSFAEWILAPTRVYVKESLEIFSRVSVKGAFHVTGGGIPGNLKRVLNDEVDAVVEKSKIPTPEVFNFFSKVGGIPEDEMWRVYNMGLGFGFILDERDLNRALDSLKDGVVVGYIKKGKGEVMLK